MEHNQPGTELLAPYDLAERSPVDPETVQKAMEGDKDAFSALFMQTYRAMFFVVRRFLDRDEDIYDALQNGYIKAYKYLPRLRSPEAFSSWLKKTMENAARDIRSDIAAERNVFYEDSEEFIDEPTIDSAESSERRADIQEVLSRLDPQQARVLTLYYYDGMKLSEIAKMTDEPQSTVRSRFTQAKKMLVDQLKVKGIDKSLYGGSVSAMIAVCLRSLIGTDILSAATAQQMLDDVLKSRQTRLEVAAYKLLEAQRNRTILRAVSLLMALTVAITCLTVAFLNGIPWKWFSARPTIAQPDFSADEPDPSAAPEWAPSSAVEDTSEPISTRNSANSPDPEQPAPDAPASSDAGAAESKTSDVSASESSVSDADTFVPDYAPGQANTIGNISQCLSRNTGLVAKQGDWLYFAEGKSFSSLMKMKTDGSQKQRLASGNGSITCINVVGDWVYYCSAGIFRVRTDGKHGGERITDEYVDDLQVIGDTGYFHTRSGGSGITTHRVCKINMNTKEITKIHQITGGTLDFRLIANRDWLLYSDGARSVIVMNLKTGAKSTLSGGNYDFLLDGDRIYYLTKDYLVMKKCTDLDAAPQEIIYERDIHANRLLFFSPYSGGIWGYGATNSAWLVVSSSNKKFSWRFPDSLYANNLYHSFEDGYVYFYSADATLCRIRADGSDYHSFS